MPPRQDIRCDDCGAPATHEVLPRTRRGSRYVCDQGARVLDVEHRRRLVAADFEMPIAEMAPGELVEVFGK